jgi:hypothetical protein
LETLLSVHGQDASNVRLANQELNQTPPIQDVLPQHQRKDQHANATKHMMLTKEDV